MPLSAIVGYGMYVPRERIRTADIAAHWRKDPAAVIGGLGVREKTVPAEGDDAFTLAFEASKLAIASADISPAEISAVFVGSESHPYAVKPTSGMLADALKVDPFCHCADLEFACKAGTAGVQITDAFVRAEQIRYGLAVGSDTAQAEPGDALEYTAAAGAAALVIGPANAKNAVCVIEKTLSFTTDTPDFWRAADAKFPSHGGRFTGEPGYFAHMRTTIRAIFEVSGTAAKDFDHVILHMPNAKFPQKIAKEFGFTEKQMEHGFVVTTVGNTYSACSLLGLVRVLQSAKKNDRILLVSYGSGSGCDAFVMKMLRSGKSPKNDGDSQIEYLDYASYSRRMVTRH